MTQSCSSSSERVFSDKAEHVKGAELPAPVEVFSRTDVRHWRQHLINRRYCFPASNGTERDLAARIDHDGVGYFFPLGTSKPDVAAVKALNIYQTVSEKGWVEACRSCSRELIVSFEWSSNPILWTYTTIHTLVGKIAAAGNPASETSPDSQRVLVVEADAGIRRALAWCVNQHTGFRAVQCESPEHVSAALELNKPGMVLLNRNLAERIGFSSPGDIAPIRPGVPAITYSTAMDGDHMFVSTPGGAEGYLLKRVKPDRVLEPILNLAGRPELLAEDLLVRVKSYFEGLLKSRSDHDASALARLTRRERDVLALLSKGCVDKEIAQALGISAWTVHGHVKNIFERLGVRTRTEAVIRYLEK